MPSLVHHPYLQYNLIRNIRETVIFDRNCCKHHDIHSLMLKTITRFFIITYLRHINKILRGKISSNNFKDPVRIESQKVYLKRKTFEQKKRN